MFKSVVFRFIITAIALVLLTMSGMAELKQPPDPAADADFLIIFSGSRRSELVPCGCKGSKQTGGVDRDATYFKNLRAEGQKPALFLDAGGWTDTFISENERLKTAFLIAAMGKLQFDAINVGFQDLGIGKKEVLRLAEQHNLPLVSANIIEKSTMTPLFPPYRIKTVKIGGKEKRIGIIGVTATKEEIVKRIQEMRAAMSQSTTRQVATPIPTMTPPVTKQREIRITPTPTPSPTLSVPRANPAISMVTPRVAEISATKTPAPSLHAPQPAFTFEGDTGSVGDFRQGPQVFKRKVLSTPTPAITPYMPSILALMPPPDTSYKGSTPPIPQSETQYKPVVPMQIRRETEYVPAIEQKDLREKEFEATTDTLHRSKGDGDDPCTTSVSISPTSGASSRTEEDYIFIPVEEAVKKYLPTLEAQTDMIVLLAFMDRGMAKEMAPLFPRVDLLIAGNFSFPEVYMLEKVNNTALVNCSYNGQKLGKVSVFLDEEVEPLNYRYDDVYLTIETPKDAEMEELINEYKKETAKLYDNRRQAMARKMTYASASACKRCHVDAHKQWETTKHAHAMDTLIKDNQQFNPDCLPCHTTGYKEDNGFFDYRSTPTFGDVQCENCHGPAYRHMVEATRWKLLKMRAERTKSEPSLTQPPKPNILPQKTVPETVCLKCHTPERDDDFNYTRDLELVKHEDTQAE